MPIDAPGPGTTRPNEIRPNEIRPDVARPDVARPDPAPPDRIDLDTIKPTRYPVATLLTQLADKLPVLNNAVERPVADQIRKLLNGERTDVLTLNDGTAGRLFMSNAPGQGPQIQVQAVRPTLELKAEYLGHTFTEQDKTYLKKYGEMGRRVELRDKFTGETFPGYVGVDKATNALTVLRAERLRIPDTIKGVPLNAGQKARLSEGKALRLDKLTGNDGQPFSAYVRISAAKRSLTFQRINPVQAKQQTPESPAKQQTAAAKQKPDTTPGQKPDVTTKPKVVKPRPPKPRLG